jgi:hypothetical protein
MAESNCSGPTRATLFGATSHHTEQSTTQNFQIPLKGIKLLLGYWWHIRQPGLHGPPE